MYLLTFQVACLQFSKLSFDKELSPQREKMYHHLQGLGYVTKNLPNAKILRTHLHYCPMGTYDQRGMALSISLHATFR